MTLPSIMSTIILLHIVWVGIYGSYIESGYSLFWGSVLVLLTVLLVRVDIEIIRAYLIIPNEKMEEKENE